MDQQSKGDKRNWQCRGAVIVLFAASLAGYASNAHSQSVEPGGISIGTLPPGIAGGNPNPGTGGSTNTGTGGAVNVDWSQSGGTTTATYSTYASVSLTNGVQATIGTGGTSSVDFIDTANIDGTSALNIGNGGSLTNSGTLTNNGTLTNSGTLINTGTLINNGTLIDTGTGTIYGNIVNNGTLKLNNQALTLGSSGNSTQSGNLSTTGNLTKTGTGTLTLNGANTFGGTSISAGTLEVGDINTPTAKLTSAVTVDAAGTLRGHGTVIGDVANNGTVAPGGSIGTLTVNGNYTQASAATLAIEVSPTAASQLKVNGNATLAGTLALTYDPGTYTAKTYTLVSANSVTGRFGNVTSSGAPGLASSISYSADAVDLTLGSSGPQVIAPTQTSAYSASGATALMNAQDTTSTLLDRANGSLSDRRGSGTGLSTGDAYASHRSWASLIGSHTTVSGNNGQPGYQANQYGFLAGIDRNLGETTAGMAAGYAHTDLQEQGTGDSGKIDTLRAALYASRRAGPFSLSAAAGYGLDFLSQNRPFSGIGTARSSHLGQEFAAGMQATLPMSLQDGFWLTPKAGLRFAYFHGNAFGESGASGQNLQVGTDSTRSLQPYVELAAGKRFGSESHPIDVQARVGYAQEVLSSRQSIEVASQDGTLFTAPGTDLPRSYLTTGIGVTMHPTENLSVSLSYDALINTGRVSAQRGELRVSYLF